MTYHREVRNVARVMKATGATPTNIARALPTAPRLRHLPPEDRSPSLKTVKNWTNDIRMRAKDDPVWDFTGADPEDRRAIAAAFAYGLGRGLADGLTEMEAWPSQAEGDWMVRVARLDPKLPASRVWELGKYAASVAHDEQEVRSIVASLMVQAARGVVTRATVKALRASGFIGGTATLPELERLVGDASGPAADDRPYRG